MVSVESRKTRMTSAHAWNADRSSGENAKQYLLSGYTLYILSKNLGCKCFVKEWQLTTPRAKCECAAL